MRPLTDPQLANALRAAAKVAGGDRQHNLMTALDVLAQDRRPEFRGIRAQQQLAYAVAAFTHPTTCARRPVDLAEAWCRERGVSLAGLLRAVADSVEDGALPAAA